MDSAEADNERLLKVLSALDDGEDLTPEAATSAELLAIVIEALSRGKAGNRKRFPSREPFRVRAASDPKQRQRQTGIHRIILKARSYVIEDRDRLIAIRFGILRREASRNGPQFGLIR